MYEANVDISQSCLPVPGSKDVMGPFPVGVTLLGPLS